MMRAFTKMSSYGVYAITWHRNEMKEVLVVLLIFSFCFPRKLPNFMFIVAGGNPPPPPPSIFIVVKYFCGW